MELLIGGGAVIGASFYIWKSFINKKTIPDGITCVSDFQLDKFLGTWYEIARLDYKKEKDLDNVVSILSLLKDGAGGNVNVTEGIDGTTTAATSPVLKVINTGFNTILKKFETVEGTAQFVKSKSYGQMIITFFRPFYSGFNVIQVDNDYQYALIAGRSLDYLWLMSKTTTIPDEIKEKYLNYAQSLGYDINSSKFIWVKHDKTAELPNQ